MVLYAFLDIPLTDVHNPRLYTTCTPVPNYIDAINVLAEILVL